MLDLWNSFGIVTSPFFQEALDLALGSRRPIDLFVGREEEATHVLRRLASTDSSRLVVEGRPGVGKTTFIQHVKARLSAEHAMAVASDHCRAPHDLDATSLGTELLRSALRGLHLTLGDRASSIQGFEAARRLVEESERLSLQWSLSVLGSGGGLGADRQRDRPAFLPSQFQDALSALTRGARTAGVNAIVVHINNVDNLESHPNEAALLFRDARDYFLTPGLHVLLGATEGFSDRILATHAQVRSIFPVPTRLGPLPLPRFRELLARRLDFLRIDGMTVVSPVSDELVAAVYQLFHGDLRSMLGALEEACLRALGALRPEPLTVDQARATLAPIYREQLAQSLSATELDHLWRLAASGHAEFRQAEAIDVLALSPGRVSKLFSSLERADAVTLVRTEGRSRFYTLGGRTRLALGVLEGRTVGYSG